MTEYPTHEEIADQIMKLVESNLQCPHTHNRVNLSYIIADLMQYRDTIPTSEEYVDKAYRRYHSNHRGVHR